MHVGTVIRRLRKAMGMTMEVLADQIGTDPGNLSRIERGVQNYTPEMLETIAKHLGTTPSALIGEAENEWTTPPRTIRTEADEAELLIDYRKLRGSARSLLRLMAAEMARTAEETNSHR